MISSSTGKITWLMSQRSNCSHHWWVQTSLIGPLWWTWFLSINMIDFDRSSGAFSFRPMSSTGKDKTQIEPVFLALSSESPDQDKKACIISAARSQSVASLCRWTGMCSEFTQHDGPESATVHNMPKLQFVCEMTVTKGKQLGATWLHLTCS